MEDYRVTQTGDEIQEILNQSPIDTADIVELKEAATLIDGRLESVEVKIPAGASEENPLTDKQYVDDSIASASATFRGTYNEVTDLELTTEATHADIGSALDEVIELADSNDYCFVQIPTADATPTEIESIERYKFVTGTGWQYEYTLNNSGFTADQWAAINSGITSGLVVKLTDLPTNAELNTLLNGKANAADVYTKSETYTKIEIDTQLGAKANSADVYPKTDTYTKQEVDALITTPEVQYVTVTATSGTTSVTDVLPATGAANTIYRVGSWDGTQYATGVYSEYAWNGTTYILLDVKNYGFATGSDFDNPTTAQRELVTTVGSVLDGISEGVFDLTAKTGDSYATLADALTAANTAIPTNKKKGGMSIKFVQSSDNNSVYVQYRLMADEFTADTTQWQGVDTEPIPGSKNLVESGGVAKIIDGPLYIEYGKRFLADGYMTDVAKYACTNKLQGNGGSYTFPRTGIQYKVFRYISDTEGEELSGGRWKSVEITLEINGTFIVTFNHSTPDWTPLVGYTIGGISAGLKGEIENLKSGKVDKVQGKGLSTEDFTSEEKTKLDALPTNSELTASFGNKVDKAEGKGLSENDFTDDLKDVVDKVDDNLVYVAGVSSKNMVNLAALVSGYRVLKTNGSLYADASYSYITLDVTGISNLAISASISITSAFAFAFYNGDTFISGDNPSINTADSYGRKYVSVSVPNNATKMIVSTYTNTWNARYWQIEEGTVSTSYEPYSPPTAPEEFLKDSFLSPVLRTVLGSGGLRGYAATLTDGQSISIPCGSIRKNQRIHFYAKIGTFDTILVGKGITNKGYLLKVDTTNIQFKAGIDGAGGSIIPHGLTIEAYIDVIITISSDSNFDIQIDTLNGSYTRHVTNWANVMGDVVAISDGSSLTECILTWNCADFKKPIWAYGDSYFSHYSENRWPYYMIVRDENDCCLLNAFPGEDSQEAYADFLENAKQGVPKILLWCLGMNDPDSGSVNADWLAVVEHLEEYCRQYDTELILATIPCVPQYSHVYKNAWVKASGHRYIDFAEAVDAEEAGSTWISGTLSTDNVHPTANGARLLYSRAISDVQELLGGDVKQN